MPPVGFEPTISAGERPQTYALDRAATGPPTTQLNVEAGLGMRGAMCPLYIAVYRHCIHRNNFTFSYQTLPTLQY